MSSTSKLSVQVLPIGNNSHTQASNPSYDVLPNHRQSTTTGDVRQAFNTVTRVTRETGNTSLLTILLIVAGIIIFIVIVIFIVLYVLKRNKLDKIRHHLMPLYNFDPADEEPHWEADLMEDDREQQIALNTTAAPIRPKLKFHMQGDVDM